MPYGTKGAIGGGMLAATGFAIAGWLVRAVPLTLMGMALLMLARRSPQVRP